jgi:hypothetical protein
MKYLIGIGIGVALILWFPEFLPWVKGSVTEAVCPSNNYMSLK